MYATESHRDNFVDESQTVVSDKEILNKAVEYFQGGKYHEALLMFKKLGCRYELNTRFKAYMGICYYYDEEYEECANVIDSVANALDVFAPHEQSVYYYCAAESHLQMKHMQEAINYYEKVLLLCYDNEKGDVLSGLARCYRSIGEMETSQEYYISAKAYYEQFNDNGRIVRMHRAIIEDNGKEK